MSLWDAMVELLSPGYNVPTPLPGVRVRTGSHSSDGDPLATAKKDAMWYSVLNWAKSFTNAGFRPPWNWCGFRASDDACVCVNYLLEIFREVIHSTVVAGNS